jgi:penicillin-binding protein 2
MSSRPRDTTRLRLGVTGIVVAALFGTMFVRLWYLQVLHSQGYQATVVANQVRPVFTEAPRGVIYDRNGQVLADNAVITTVTLQRQVAASRPDVVARLAALLGMTQLQVHEQLTNPRYSPYRPVPIQTGVPEDVALYIKEHKDLFPGVDVELDTERHYPQGETAANLIGYVGQVNASELARYGAGYHLGDTVGKSGVEEAYEHFLHGRPGVTDLEVNARGQVVRTLKATQPVPGDDVQLTLDLGLQQEVERDLTSQIMALRGTSDPKTGQPVPAPQGAAVVLDPNNGDVLAMASYPTFNPSDFVGGISQAKFAQYNSDPVTAPLLNKAIAGHYTPGSTFKIATATAALNSGLWDATKTYDDSTGSFTVPNCRAYPGSICTFFDDDSAAQGTINITQAIAVSDDVFFYNLGYLFWINQAAYGKTPVQDVAAHYGLGQDSGIPLPGESPGFVGTPQIQAKLHQQDPKDYPDGTWTVGDNIEMAFGQGLTNITPLQLANAYATFANGGTRYQPQVAARVLSPSGRTVESTAPRAVDHVPLPPSTRDPMLQGFEGVTQYGTAAGTFAGFDQSSFQVAGKTGTASSAPGKEPTSLFVCFAPAASPRYVVAVVIDQAGYGATGSAPVARAILQYLEAHPIGPVKAPPASGS